MVRESVRFRVHLAAVGFEVVRVVEPIQILHGERVILLTKSRTDQAQKFLEKSHALLKKTTEVDIVECNLWDTNAVVGEVGRIVHSAPQHEYFFNCSSGPKTACIAGTVAGMLWNVQPYYVAVDYSKAGVYFGEDYPLKGEIQFVPTFDVETLDAATVQALKFIVERPKAFQKHELLDHLRDTKIVRPKAPRRGKTKVTPQAYQAQVDVILRRLEDRGYVEQRREGNRRLISATERGREGLKVFRFMLDPLEETPRVLRA